jgi:hypothetical protein
MLEWKVVGRRRQGVVEVRLWVLKVQASHLDLVDFVVQRTQSVPQALVSHRLVVVGGEWSQLTKAALSHLCFQRPIA